MTGQRMIKISILTAFVLFIVALIVLSALAAQTQRAGFDRPYARNSAPAPVPIQPITPSQALPRTPPEDVGTQTQSPMGRPTTGKVGAASTIPGSPLLLPAVTYDTGGYNPYSVAIADVNGDGKPDLVVANQCSSVNSCPTGNGTVGVLLGNGDGTFQAPADYDAGEVPANSVIVTDVNGDGKPDIVVVGGCSIFQSCTADGVVSVLLGNGNGTFQPAITYGSGGVTATSVVAADVNGDGKLDLLVSNECADSNCATGSVGVLLGNGDSTFKAAVMYGSGGDFALGLAVADLNGDGRPDLVVADFCNVNSCLINQYPLPDGAIGVLLGKGDGTFQPVVTYDPGGQGTKSVVIADVNGDGKADLLSANCGPAACSPQQSGGTVGILLGNGDGTFQAAASYVAGNSPDSIASADMNGDGKPDVVVGNWGISNGESNDGAVTTLLGNGDGTFQSAQTFLSGGNEATSVAVTDVNGDGRPDVVLGDLGSFDENLPPGIVSVLLNNTGRCAKKCPTSTVLASSLNPSIYGQKITWTATVTTSSSLPPTGKVNFTWGGGRYSFGTATLNSSGVATLTKSLESADSYQLTAVYSGDANNLGSTSAALKQVITEATSSATLTSSPNPSTQAQAVTFTTTISSPTVEATGPVTFTAGKTVLGTAQLSGGKAKFTTSTLTVGSTTVTATYRGDSNIAGSSASVTQTVQP
jgi:hypothetical protein